MKLVLDFETRSRCDLTKRGAHIYANDPSTDILCMSWAIDDAPIRLWKPSDGALPPEIVRYLSDGGCLYAWNSQFERLIWNGVGRLKYGFPPLPVERFICIAALARARGYPGKLDSAARFQNGKYLKDMEGHRVMMRLCKPRDDGTWNEDPEDLQALYDYCIQDTEVERYFNELLLPFSDEELRSFHLCERLNDRGILCDRKLAQKIVESVGEQGLDAQRDLQAITDGAVEKPTQVARILAWLETKGYQFPNLNKGTIYDFIEDNRFIPDDIRTVLEIRLDNAKASVSKFTAMCDRSNESGILRGLFLWRGAGQTGRYASMGVQIHNLVKESAPEAIPVFMKHGIRGLSMLGPPMKMFSKMVRPSFIPFPKNKLLIGDYSQIEARIAAWLAGEDWILEAFRAGRDLYCEFGGIAFERPITKADEMERAASKACMLGLQFGGAEGALDRSLRTQAGIILPGETLTHLVQTYRTVNKKIKKYWRTLDNVVLSAMYHPNEIFEAGRVSYFYDGVHLWCKLPSERLICYPFAEIYTDTKFDEPRDAVRYRRGNRKPKAGTEGWPTVDLWYGITMENLCQAIALDLLDGAVERLEEDDRLTVRGHVHDEVVSEAPESQAHERLSIMLGSMKVLPAWADGLPIEAEGKVVSRYAK